MDVPEGTHLVDVDHALLVELEDGEEADHDLQALVEVSRHTPEGRRSRGRQRRDQFVDGVRDADPNRCDVERVDMLDGPRLERPQIGPVQVGGHHTVEQVGRQVKEVDIGSRPARPREARLGGQPAENDCSVLEGLALQQSGQQEVAFLPRGELLVEVEVVVAGKQPSGLELDEDRRYEKELGGHLEVEFPEATQLGDELVDDRRQLDLVELHLLLQNQVQQQVEGALVDGGGDCDAHGSRP